MSISIYDFDTQYAPFEAFGSYTPYAPFALFALLAAPMYGWMGALVGTYGSLSDAMVSAMTYPFELPVTSNVPMPLSKAESSSPHIPTPDSKGQGASAKSLEAV